MAKLVILFVFFLEKNLSFFLSPKIKKYIGKVR